MRSANCSTVHMAKLSSCRARSLQVVVAQPWALAFSYMAANWQHALLPLAGAAATLPRGLPLTLAVTLSCPARGAAMRLLRPRLALAGAHSVLVWPASAP